MVSTFGSIQPLGPVQKRRLEARKGLLLTPGDWLGREGLGVGCVHTRTPGVCTSSKTYKQYGIIIICYDSYDVLDSSMFLREND